MSSSKAENGFAWLYDTGVTESVSAKADPPTNAKPTIRLEQSVFFKVSASFDILVSL